MRLTDDRRAHPRVALQQAATAMLATGSVSCRLVDVSLGGLGVETEQASAPGEFMRLNFALPVKGRTTPLVADAVVVRTSDRAQACFWGLQFVQLDDTAKNMIESFVADAAEPPARKLAAKAPATEPKRDLDSLREAALRELRAQQKRLDDREGQPAPRQPTSKGEFRKLFGDAIEDLGGKKKP